MQDFPRKSYLAYLTANDDPTYKADYFNFLNMAQHHPGVSHIHIYIAVSEVNELSPCDRKKISQIAEILDCCEWLTVQKILFKSNVGRDFSSAESCLGEISKVAGQSDWVMVKNRSGYGPNAKSWYYSYIQQYQKLSSGGLVGSTINFAGHPAKPAPGKTTHIQTYIYLGELKVLAPLIGNYPAAKCVDRVELIVKGEIGLSQYILNQGMQLTCLHWPNSIFSSDFSVDRALPQHDIKSKVTDVPIRYKYSGYFYNPRNFSRYLIWQITQAIARLFNPSKTNK
jgi:hypothetical protein